MTGVEVTVVGAGAWGTTLAALIAPRVSTRLWVREPEVVAAIAETGENTAFLPGIRLPAELAVAGDLRAAVDGAGVVVVAVPAQHVRATMASAAPAVARTATVVSATKGIEAVTLQRMSEVLAGVLPDHEPAAIGVLSGPNLAREIAAGAPAATCVAFPDPDRARTVQGLLMSDVLRVYTSGDVVGCEIGGAAKNVIAIAAGMADGLGYGMNTKAALITRGLAELTRLGVGLGGRPLTFLGLAGNGDLVATCSSPLSRNRSLGEELARGHSAAEVAGSRSTVAEGAATAPALLALAGRVAVDVPIIESVVDVLAGVTTAADVVGRLMRRSPKAELHGLDPDVGATTSNEERDRCRT